MSTANILDRNTLALESDVVTCAFQEKNYARKKFTAKIYADLMVDGLDMDRPGTA